MVVELNISYVVKKLMDKLNYSIDDMAHYLDIDSRQIFNYISVHNKPSLKVFNKIVSLIEDHNLDIYDLLDIDSDEGYLFHGSKTGGIVGKISTKRNIKDSNDFGNGFYLSEAFRTALTYVLTYNNPVIYRFNKNDVVTDNIFSFYDDRKNRDEDWVIYIGLNRGHIKEERDYQFFNEYYSKAFKKYDLLKGEIADSYNFDVIDYFFDNQIDINIVKTALAFANIGPQYVLKNESIANRLKWVEEYHIDPMLRNYLISLLRKKKDSLRRNVYNITPKLMNNFESFDVIKNKKKAQYE